MIQGIATSVNYHTRFSTVYSILKLKDKDFNSFWTNLQFASHSRFYGFSCFQKSHIIWSLYKQMQLYFCFTDIANWHFSITRKRIPGTK